MDGTQRPHSGRCTFSEAVDMQTNSRVCMLVQKALYFPNIAGSRLDNGERTHTTYMCAGKVSVVAMLTTKMSEVRCCAPPLFGILTATTQDACSVLH